MKIVSYKAVVFWLLAITSWPIFAGDDHSASDSELSSATGSAPADFYAPAPVIELLELSREFDWPALQAEPSSLSRFAMGSYGNDDIFIATDDGSQVSPNLSVVSNATAQSSSSYDLLLRSMFKFIELGDGTFQIVSSKHPNYVLDIDEADSNALILRDIRSVFRDDEEAAFLGFNISGLSPLVLSAASRWVNTDPPQSNRASQNYVLDKQWTRKNVLLADNQLVLTSGEGTPMQLYSAPINFDIPWEFNPREKQRTGNPEVTPFSRSSYRHVELPNQALYEYRTQLSAPGLNAATTAAAEAMLASIEQSLGSQGTKLRYPAEFYMAFREGMLKRVYLSAEAADAHLGINSVPYVYFTNAKDEQGVYHPFMVIATYGLPDTEALLWDVTQPPGDGLTRAYSTQEVTRSYHKEGFLMKVPMKDYGVVTEIGENKMVNDLGSDKNVRELDHHNYASVSGLGVAIDGVVIYPTYNNALHVSAAEGELSAHGQHAGQGLGTHYHADAYAATGEILNLYNATDYIGRSHPPIVSIGFDGVAGYGIYQSDDSDGAWVPLDEFGGHDHGGYGYHYHSFSVEEITSERGQTKTYTYTAHKLPPLGAWAGYINDIPDFWDGTSPGYGGRGATRWLGTGTEVVSPVRRRQ